MGLKDVKVNVDIDGFLDFRHLDPSRYSETVKDFQDRFGRGLPSKAQLKNMGKPRDLRLLLTPITITITWPDTRWIQYHFEPGFITDLSSVPGFFRSVVDNDDIDMMSAALCHDVNFSLHHLSFKQTNQLFYHMIMSRFDPDGDGVDDSDHWVSLPARAKWAYLAVNSFVGRIRWKQNKRKRQDWTLATTKFMKSR